MLVDNAQELNSVLLGLSLIAGLRKLYPEEFDIAKVMNLLGNAEAMRKLENGKTPFEALRSGSSGMREFMSKRQQSLLYGPSPKRTPPSGLCAA